MAMFSQSILILFYSNLLYSLGSQNAATLTVAEASSMLMSVSDTTLAAAGKVSLSSSCGILVDSTQRRRISAPNTS